MTNISYCRFFLNHLDFQISLPLELFGVLIKRATKNQQIAIQVIIDKIAEDPLGKIQYKNEITFTNKDEGYETNLKQIESPNERLYWIVETKDKDSVKVLDVLPLVFCISSKHIRLDFKFEWNYDTESIAKRDSTPSVYNYYNDFRFNQKQKDFIEKGLHIVTNEYIKEIVDLTYQFLSVFQEGKNLLILNAINKFYRLNLIHSDADIKPLSYFAIWEMLLVQKPDPKDPTSSITRQITNKTILLNNRMINKIDFESYMKSSSPIAIDKFIKILYGYRSSLAHGDSVDFNNRCKPLGDDYNTEKLLFEITNKLLLQALTESQLFIDLKKC